MDWGSPDLKLVCLKGNHEDIMRQCCRQPIKAGWWMDNGGGATLISYEQNYGDIVNVKVVPEQHLRWIEALPLMHVDRHRVYVHAGVDPDLPLAAQDPDQLLWRWQSPAPKPEPLLQALPDASRWRVPADVPLTW